MIVRGFIMIKDSIFEQLEHDNRFNKRNCRGLSLITDRSFNEFYLGLGKDKPAVQSEIDI